MLIIRVSHVGGESVDSEQEDADDDDLEELALVPVLHVSHHPPVPLHLQTNISGQCCSGEAEVVFPEADWSLPQHLQHHEDVERVLGVNLSVVVEVDLALVPARRIY